MSPCFTFVRRKQNNNKEIFLAILGLDNSGKTTISLSIKGVSSDLVAPTIGFDRIEFAIDSFNINLYDLGGGRTIRDIWETYFAEVYGVIFVVDSSTPERLEECHEALVNVLSHPCISGKPILLLANKRDIKGALDESELIAALQLDDLVNEYKCPCRLEHCCALLLPNQKLDKAIREGLKWLLAYIQSDLINIQSRVGADVDRQIRQQTEERAARKERVRLAREERERLRKLSNQHINNTFTAGSLDDLGENSNELINQQLTLKTENTCTVSNIFENNLCSDSPKYKEPTNLPELNQYNDIQFVQINPLVSDVKNNSLACSQLNSRDLLHQIKLACSIDLEFQNKKLSLDSYRGFDKEGLFIELERQLHISVDDSKGNDNTRTITEKHDEVSKQFSLSPSVSNGHKKDVELQPEFMEMNMSKSKLQCDKDYSIPQTANGSARFVNRTPTVVHSLYEKNSSSVKISVHQSFNVQKNPFEKVEHRDNNSSLSGTVAISKLTKGPSPLARIFVSNFNKLHPITDQKPEGSMSSISQSFTSEEKNNSDKFYATSVSNSNLKSSD
ncbi:ADP-ribosylation factor-like protein 13B [Schistosoma haematobium]|uniref:ADP-ribosylation factor-like protein 13B n=3 Tax=Schistosoma TaxID=6181 RepID=A0A094ZUN8_SCHHA|nr:ADP-ribosylation factor-like protein 13B [Schistosoma haematobium]KAH9590516.1 ADP-ribosylation factor-like protein 13B [Schistosoma haematobium]CAH8657804.1 unnamed protein product [Schistosoma haematobium]CAH8663949.1 unnamed protein product [Schistosoma haematobium]